MAEEIVRRPDRAEGGLTEDEKARMAVHAQMWIDNAMRVGPTEHEPLKTAIKALYHAADLKEPVVVVVSSPLVMALAGGFASAVVHMRKQNFLISGDTKRDDAAMVAAMREAVKKAIPEGNPKVAMAVYAAVQEATGLRAGKVVAAKAEKDMVDFLLACAGRWYVAYQGGNMWASWECYLTAARDILGLRLPEHEKYAAWEQCAKLGGFRFMHEDFCIVTEFPVRLFKDVQHRPHCDDGPSHEWNDGWRLWHVNGVRVTEQIVMAPQTLTVKQIQSEGNAEVRRVMLKRFGYERYLRKSDATLQHEDECGKLWRAPRADDTDLVMVEVLNSTPEPDGTTKTYFLRVPPQITTAREAVAWTFDMTAGEYRPDVET